jgi:hypothetical protein
MKKITKFFSFLCIMCFAVSKTFAQVDVTISVAPPELPVYVQPACPVDGYLWEPGYWAYDDTDGYYWVPGVWVAPPQPGYLWTPAYWGFEGGYYGFHPGYWGLHVGFYGGINYGYGYGGYGYGGGRWEGGNFRYNTAVVTVNTTVIHNTYVDNTVVHNTYVNNHTSFNGQGGVTASPRPEEQAAMREQHIQPTNEQLSHQQAAKSDRNQFASVNKGHPGAAAMNKVNGHPFDEHGQTSTNSNMGHNRGATNNVNRPNRPANNVNQPNRPANNTNNTNHPATNVNRPSNNVNHPKNVQRPPKQQPRNNPRPAEPREKHN